LRPEKQVVRRPEFINGRYIFNEIIVGRPIDQFRNTGSLVEFGKINK